MRLLVCLLCLFSLSSTGQVKEDFSDGNFTKDPTWKGDTSHYIVNISKQLQLNSTGSDTACLYTSSNYVSNAEWQFWIKLSFSLSDNNFAKIYIISDKTTVKGGINGYFVRIGEDGNFDSVDLWKQTGSVETKIIDGIPGHCAGSSSILRVKVTRDSSGYWQLFSDTTGGVNYLPEGQIYDISHKNAQFIVLLSKYTSSNAKKIYFDDIYAGPIIIDSIPPRLDSLVITGLSTLDVYFDEVIDLSSAQMASNYLANNNLGLPLSAIRDKWNHSLAHLTFSSVFVPSLIYDLAIKNIKDIKGNTIIPVNGQFVLPDKVLYGEIVINEILSDPKTGGVDFVEIYNRSNKVFALKDLNICSFDTIIEVLTDIKPIIAGFRLIFPRDYIVISTNGAIVKSQYTSLNPAGFVDIPSMPAMNIVGDVIVIADSSLNIIDKMIYYEKMHFPLIAYTKGVSLERVDYNKPAQEQGNWHSAAESVGYATPAYKNSQYASGDNSTEITISPAIFSPDNNGYQDFVTISYNFQDPGWVATMTIYDSGGRLVRHLSRNQLLGTNGSFVWDGISDEGEKAGVGIYLIYTELFSAKGSTKHFKRTCVLAQQF